MEVNPIVKLEAIVLLIYLFFYLFVFKKKIYIYIVASSVLPFLKHCIVGLNHFTSCHLGLSQA